MRRDISQSIVQHGIAKTQENMQEGLARIQEDVAEMREDLHYIRRQAHTANQLSQDSYLQMPPKPRIFHGRDRFVADTVDALTNTDTERKPPRICIHGPGGMGKTAAAIAVMEDPKVIHKFGNECRFWVPCACASSPDLFIQLLYQGLRITRDTGKYLEDIIAELESSSLPRLVLLDNFETPWDPTEGSRESVENVLIRLSSVSQLSILVTMRANIPPSEQIIWIDRPLGTVDTKSSKDIYCDIHPAAKGKPMLDELLEELGHAPFAIQLLARLGNSSKSEPEALLKDWREDGPGILPLDGEMEDKISRSIRLSLTRKTIVKNEPANTLLATLAMLPAGTTHTRLDRWAPHLGGKKRAAIAALNDVALIVDSDPTDGGEVSISIHPVVRSYLQNSGRISPEVRDTVRDTCYNFVIEHQSSPGDLQFREKLRILSIEEVNVQSILLEATRHSSINNTPEIEKGLQALIAFAWYQHWTKPRTEVVIHGLELARKAQLDQHVAEFLFCLGSTLFRLDRYLDAIEVFTEARDCFRKLQNTVRASECSFELSELHQFMQDIVGAEEALNNSEGGQETSDLYAKARGELARGVFLWWSRSFAEALENLTVAKEIFESKEINRPVDAARCLHTIARSLGAMHRFTEALEAIDQALDIFKRHGPDNRLVDTLLIKSCLHFLLGSPVDVMLSTFEETLHRGQELGGPLPIAQALECFGELYARERKLQLAVEYYKAAETEYATIPGWQGDAHRCQMNCSHLENNMTEERWDVQRLSDWMILGNL